MTRIPTTRLARILAGLAGAAIACAIAAYAAMPAALATPRPRPPGWNKHPPLPAAPRLAVRYPAGWNKHPPLPGLHRAGYLPMSHAHTAAPGGLPGWQITLIAAALIAPAVAVLLARARAAWRRAVTGPATTVARALARR